MVYELYLMKAVIINMENKIKCNLCSERKSARCCQNPGVSPQHDSDYYRRLLYRGDI